MVIAVRILAALPALMFLVSGLQWIFNPEAAADGLGMPLLKGIAASSQIGDIGAFFIGVSVIAFVAQLPGRSSWFYSAAILIGAAALMRTLAWALGHAALATPFIVIELVMVAVYLFAARILQRADAPA